MYNGDMIEEMYGVKKDLYKKFTLIIEIDMNDDEQRKFMEYIRKYKIVNINTHLKELIIKKVD